ncbi:hypothetical protein OO013_15090 [Mangrovivirga sp. M17]|uniref:DUF1574 domain-containing protein n=1 Tax=Mangrovivirga halotolerans TaxID=2993936 RepID=A0ABT3RTU1_9BACT|nr:hypothetical protein [Mangrovivirga halotolerans]MCX2745204.1 hypothetical protein [Mangrovivirga halotolerans]
MNKFIKQVINFLLIIVIYCTFTGGFNYYHAFIKQLKFEQTNILIAGDSHTQKALNPSLFKSARNVSQPAEPYVITYWKLNRIFKSNIPDTLILAFTHHSISGFNDIKFSTNKWAAKEMFNRSYSIERFAEIQNDVKIDWHLKNIIKLKNILLFPKTNHHSNFIGKGYNNFSKSDINDFKTAINRHFYNNDSIYSFSKTSIEYLNKIIHLCNEKNVKIILVSPPVHEKYFNLIPDIYLKKFDSLKTSFKNQQISVFDQSDISLPESMYLNSDHLNSEGAVFFTSKVKDYIQD